MLCDCHGRNVIKKNSGGSDMPVAAIFKYSGGVKHGNFEAEHLLG